MQAFRIVWFAVALSALGLVGAHAQAAAAPWPRIDVGDYQPLVETDAVRSYFKGADSTGLRPRLLIRLEFREPSVINRINAQSALILMEFHCGLGATRDLSTTAYPRHNLKGKAASAYPGPEWEPVTAEGITGQIHETICEDYTPSPPSVWAPLRVGSWAVIENEDDTRILYSLASPSFYPRAWSRVELREGGAWNNRAFRSAQALHEFDCTAQRARTIFNVRYPEHNLQGAPDMSAGYLTWEKPQLGAPLRYIMQAACDRDAAATANRSGTFESAADYRPLERAFRYVKDDGWASMATDREAKSLVRGANGGVYPRVEIRLEYLTAQKAEGVSYRSLVELTDVDCLVGRVRPVSTTFYAKSNLTGPLGVDDTVGEWVTFEAEPGAYGLLESACHLGFEEDGDPIDPEGVARPSQAGARP
jgi:hypothetical protein